MGEVLAGLNPKTVYSTYQGKKFAADTILIVVNCATCGVTYAIPERFNRSAREYHGDTYNGWKICCPFGHTWWYTGETEKERLKRQLEATRDLLAQEERSHSATKGHVTKLKKRAAGGVCPCCNRTFQQLARHMKMQHPEFGRNGRDGHLPADPIELFIAGAYVVHHAVGSRSRCGLMTGTPVPRDEISADLPMCAKCAARSRVQNSQDRGRDRV